MVVMHTCLYAAYIKLVSRILRFRVSWKAALSFSCLLVLLFCVTFLALGLLVLLGFQPVLIGLIAWFIVQTAFGSWFFSTRATDSAGQALGWKKSALLPSLAYLMWGLTMALLQAIVSLSGLTNYAR